jgi:integrase
MTRHNPVNERVKRQYFAYLKEAKRQSEATVDAAADAIARFEQYTGWRSFKAFHIDQAIAFKRRLVEQANRRTGEPLRKATVYGTSSHLKRFFVWLAGQPGFKSRIKYSDADYFNPSESDSRVATARRERPYPTLEQVQHVLAVLPCDDIIQRRNRALIAFTILTGCRVNATASLKLKHVDVPSRSVYLDAREVRTKFSKTFTANFFEVGDEVREIFQGWIGELRDQELWGNDDPVFPATNTRLGPDHAFRVAGVKKEHWASSSPIRGIFRAAFGAAGLPYFHPHTFRRTLVALGEAVCRTPEEFKAWSQNLGHDGVLTTFTSYGAVAPRRQAELLANLSPTPTSRDEVAVRIAKVVARELCLNELARGR